MTEKLATYEAVWRQDIKSYEAVYSEWVQLRALDGDVATESQKVALREVWKHRQRLLTQFIRVKAQFDVYLEPFPFSPMMQLANDCEDLSNGIVSAVITDARSSGGRPLRRRERHDIAKAVYFLEYVEKGLLTCRNPTTTVARAFNVTRKTVQNWKKDSARLCEGVPRPHVNVSQQSMEISGDRYSIFGRGAPSE
jgi:hypothetical protein